MKSNEQRAVNSVSRAEERLEQAYDRGAWGAFEQLEARRDAAENRLQLIEEHGTELPSIVAVYRVVDHGPCDDGPSARCPHCGAGGRYIHYAITASGSVVSAMAGCIKLFPWDKRYAKQSKLVTEAYSRERKAAKDGKNLAGWWSRMIEVSEELASGDLTVEQWKEEVFHAEQKTAIVASQERLRSASVKSNPGGINLRDTGDEIMSDSSQTVKNACQCRICGASADRLPVGIFVCTANPSHMADGIVGIWSDLTYPEPSR